MAESNSLLDKEYLKEHYLQVYFEDAICQMLSNRQEGNAMKPCKFFKEYFLSVQEGSHVLLREFEFISATPYNRLCVLKEMLIIFKTWLHRQDAYNAKDYHSVLQLVWPDFPLQVVEDAFNSHNKDKKDKENCLKFLDFFKALKSSFCNMEFDYEASVLSKHIDDQIDYCSKIADEGGDTLMNLCEADSLVNFENDTTEKPLSFSNKVLDGLEFKQLLNDSDSVSSDEPISSGKLSRSSSESKEILKKTKQNKYC